MLRINREGKSALQWDKVQDSGKRSAFGTGSQRDTQDGKGRYDLIPTSMLHRLAVHYENGALKYGDNNWQKGQPLAQYYNSAMRHLQAICDADLSEDHLAATIWNVACMIDHIDKMLQGKLPIELDSFHIVEKLKEVEQNQILQEYTDEIKSEQVVNYSPHTITSDKFDVKYMVSGEMPDEETSRILRERIEATYGSYENAGKYNAAEYRISELGKKNDIDKKHRK